MADFEQNKRLGKIIKDGFGMSPIEFAKAYNDKKAVKTYNILSERNGISDKMLVSILTAYPQINKVWLLTGHGEMLNSQPPVRTTVTKSNPTQEADLIPLLPLYAQGGALNDFVTTVKASDCERIISPIKDADFAITISGDSMAPEYPSGSKILIKKINESAFIEWGKTYVLDTCNGTVIKQLRKGKTEEEVTCYSLNPEPCYEPFTIKRSDIYGIYRVLLVMSMK